MYTEHLYTLSSIMLDYTRFVLASDLMSNRTNRTNGKRSAETCIPQLILQVDSMDFCTLGLWALSFASALTFVDPTLPSPLPVP